jgi:hypothetical protein
MDLTTDRRTWIFIVLLVIVSLVIASTAFLVSNSSPFSASCVSLGIDSTTVPNPNPGFTYVCGQTSVSDGRLSITLNNYHFANGGSIDWACSGATSVINGSSGCSSPGVYLLVNATIRNVGNGNASVGADFYFHLNNSMGSAIGNGEYGANAVFPGQRPNASVPAQNGGTYLPPGGGATYWFIFYVSNVALKDTPNLRLWYLSWPEWEYGGTWEGNGGFRCPCVDTHVQLVVLDTPSKVL